MEIELTTIENFSVCCNVCGNDLDAELYRSEIIIDPCETCMEKRYNEGKEDAE